MNEIKLRLNHNIRTVEPIHTNAIPNKPVNGIIKSDTEKKEEHEPTMGLMVIQYPMSNVIKVLDHTIIFQEPLLIAFILEYPLSISVLKLFCKRVLRLNELSIHYHERGSP